MVPPIVHVLECVSDTTTRGHQSHSVQNPAHGGFKEVMEVILLKVFLLKSVFLLFCKVIYIDFSLG